ncbi:MAG: hypothetical protein GX446_03640 [Chthonomonadales bacterium]|nr:hypothetical protein [Chthonomonadales bacterium]
MTDRGAGAPSGARRRSLIALLFAVALAVGFANASVFTGRAIARARSDHRGARERAAKDIARALEGKQGHIVLAIPEPLPAEARLQALAFELRLRYECYPRSLLVLRVPSTSPQSRAADARYRVSETGSQRRPAAIVLYRGEMVAEPGWAVRRYAEGVAAIRETRTPSDAGNEPPTRDWRFGRLAVGLGALYALGACLCAAIGLSALPWPVRVALWHLIGSLSMAVVVSAGLVITDRIMVWPTYAALLLSAATDWFVRVRTGRPASVRNHRPVPADAALGRSVSMAAYALLALGVVGMIAACIGAGISWDGWTIWQFKARAFFHDGDARFLAQAAHDFAHRDYPLLVPLHSWWAYVHAGTDNDKLAQAVGLLFAADLVALTYGLTCMLSGNRCAVFAAALVAAQPAVIRHASSGYADAPLAAFLVAVAVLLVERHQAGHLRLSGLVGLALAGCLLTKNEGAAALLGVGALMISGMILGQVRLRAALLTLAVALACVTPWWATKHRLDLRSDMLGGATYPVVEASQGPGRDVERRRPLERVPVILEAIGQSLTSVGPRYPAWGLAWVIAAVGVWALWRMRRSGRTDLRIFRAPLLVLGAQALACTAAYMATPHALEWHLRTSLDRLMMQALPLALVVGIGGLTGHAASQPGRVLDEDGLESESSR